MNSNSTSADLANALFDAFPSVAAAHPEARLAFRPETVDGSYYRRAYRPILERDAMASVEGGELAALRELWERENPGLLTLLPGLEKIAATLAVERAVEAEDPDEPSKLIYQMW